MPTKIWRPMLMAIVLVLTACSPGDSVGEDTTTSVAAPTSTETPVTSSTTAPTPTTTTVPATTTTPPPTTTTVDSNQLAEGSGCTPGTDELPDGVWYGTVDSYETEWIAFDLACWFSGDAAVIASAEDGEESPPPNDYYVRNQNSLLRYLTVPADAPVRWYLSGDPNEYVDGTFTERTESLDTAPFWLGIWVTTEDGVVTEIEEQWVP